MTSEINDFTSKFEELHFEKKPAETLFNNDIWTLIFLEAHSISFLCQASRVCQRWYHLVNENVVWLPFISDQERKSSLNLNVCQILLYRFLVPFSIFRTCILMYSNNNIFFVPFTIFFFGFDIY